MMQIFSKHTELERVVLFGSRAKPGSDVDILLQGPKVDFSTIASIHGDFEDSTLPYFFDVLDENTLSSDELKEHIRQYGVEIYQRP